MKYLFVLIFSIIVTQLYAQHDVPPTAEFVIKGSVKKELKVTTDNLLRLHQDSLGDIIIRNKRGEQKGIAVGAKGVLLKTILDSAEIIADKHRDYSEISIVLIASDDYTNVYSWNELFNTDIGNHVYIVTEMDNKPIGQMPDRILVISMSDFNSGRRHLKGLARIEIKKVK